MSSLRALYLSNNNFSGEIPSDAFKGMNLIRRVYLGNNGFSGKIPKSLASLSKLLELLVQNNKFVGRIPDFKQKDLIANFTNNKLEGPIPSVLSNENSSSFAERFELQDLIRASAEFLGSASSGSSYKAILLSGPAVVVKRYKQMSNVGKADFYEHMRKLGSISHPNLLPLVAVYYKKEEKLLINDFAENGSLASHLHSNRKPNQQRLDWPTRLRIIKGVGKGLDYLYKAFPNISLPRGHLKSSNVLLDETFEPLLADYGLVPMMKKEHAYQFMVAYKSPESAQDDHRLTRKTYVWCLGILILEMLTGKFPENYLKQGKGRNADLTSWVNSVV
ncbi:Protein kinase domain-containing protein [Heracleum sosnowskyi]|uniref:Protein kinase domain-containing protein n=1 Tax=Heracleum sosnowskyi TaxID=360622 RepID=A0AAD8HT43_9APIA|nr:Protein kinase domain-containing protein [Heracleum sosnowskyi]